MGRDGRRLGPQLEIVTPLLAASIPPSPPAVPFVRVEYLDFQNVGEHREFRLRVCRSDGWTELRLRIAIAAFNAAGVRLQDGPDICYQRVLQEIAAGETARRDVITIDAGDLASYRVAHTPVSKHRSWTSSSPTTPATVPRKQPREPSPRLPVAPLVTSEPALAEGQRVSHAIFGVGVTSSSNSGHTVVLFDQGGPKTFVTSMLQVEVLSPPHTWETSPRGKNRPCRTLSQA